MRRLDRYIFRETLVPGLIGLVALTFIVFSRQSGLLLDIIVRQAPTAAEVWAVVAALLPAVLTVTIPMAVLVGILTGFSRISSDSEAIAMRASGISMWRILRPVMALAILASAVTFWLTVWVAPQTTANLRSLQAQLALKYPSLDLRPQIFYERPNWPWVIFFHDFIRGGGTLQMRGVLLVDTKDPDNPEVTFAESGSIIPYESSKTLQVTLFNSSKHIVSPKLPNQYEILSFPERNTLSVPLPSSSRSSSPTVEEVATKELWERMQKGTATLPEQVQLYQRLALPFGCIAFALLALPLGVSTSRGGRSMGLVLSLILMFAYYLALVGGTRVTGVGTLSPALSAWLPNIIFTALGLFMMARSDRRHENRALAWLAHGLQRTSGVLSSAKGRGTAIMRWAYSLRFRLRFFRLLDAYVLRGFCFFFAIVLGVLSSLFIVVTLFELLPDIIKNQIPLTTVLTYFLFLLPQIFYWVIPLAVLLAILINLGTLTKANEILAVKAGAVSLYRMSLPLIMMGALLSGVVYAMQDYMLPWTNRTQDEYHDIIKNRAPQTYRDPYRKWMMGSASRLYYYSFFDPGANSFANISILSVDPRTFQLREWLYAKRATWNGGGWNFEDGWVREISENQKVSHEERFSLRQVTSMDGPSYFKKEVREADQMNYAELQNYVADLQRSGLDVTGLTVDLYRKLSFPLVSLIMSLIGIPFSFKTGRKGAFYGIGLCLAVGILYWSTFELFGKLGGINQLSPVVAAWFPNLIFGAGGFWMMLRVKT